MYTNFGLWKLFGVVLNCTISLFITVNSFEHSFHNKIFLSHFNFLIYHAYILKLIYWFCNLNPNHNTQHHVLTKLVQSKIIIQLQTSTFIYICINQDNPGFAVRLLWFCLTYFQSQYFHIIIWRHLTSYNCFNCFLLTGFECTLFDMIGLFYLVLPFILHKNTRK